MNEVAFKDRRPNAKAARKLKVPFKVVENEDGKRARIYTLDIASPDFGDAFEQVFQSAVNKARRENKRVIGTPDVAPPRR